jgi:hypothetical protein
MHASRVAIGDDSIAELCMIDNVGSIAIPGRTINLDRQRELNPQLQLQTQLLQSQVELPT